MGSSVLILLQHRALFGYRGQVSLELNDIVIGGGLAFYHKPRMVVPIIASLPGSARIRPELPVHKFLVQQESVFVSGLAFQCAHERVEFFTKLDIASHRAFGIIDGPDNSHCKAGPGQLVPGHEGMGACDFLVEKPVQVVAEFGGVVKTKEDGHIRLWSVKHPVRNAFALQLRIEWRRQRQQTVAIFGREGISNLGVREQSITHSRHLADFSGFQNRE